MGATRAAQATLITAILAFVAFHAASAQDSPVGTLPQGLRALDTSFSRAIAKALKQSNGPTQASISSYKEEDGDGDSAFDLYWHATKKPTLGQWFQDLYDSMQKELDPDSQHEHDSGSEYSKEPSSSSYDEPEKEQYPDSGDQHTSGDTDDKYDGKEKYSDHTYAAYPPGSDSGYDSHHGEHEYRGYPEEPYHQQEDHYKQEGPKHEQYYGSEQYQRYKEQYSHSHHSSKAEEACLQEVARTDCQAAGNTTTTTNDDTVRFTSALGCCFSYQEQEDKYYSDPAYSGEPDYPPYASVMMQRPRRDNAVKARPASITVSSTAPEATAAAKLAYYRGYDTPIVFYPRGGNSECVWSIAYHAPVQVDETTTQIGIASATCHFNGSMHHCDSPLGTGVTLTIQADVYHTTNAVSKQAPSTVPIPAECAVDTSAKRTIQQRAAPQPLASPPSAPTKPVPHRWGPPKAAQPLRTPPKAAAQPLPIPPKPTQPVTSPPKRTQPIITRPQPQPAPHSPQQQQQHQQPSAPQQKVVPAPAATPSPKATPLPSSPPAKPQQPAAVQPTPPTQQPTSAVGAQQPSAFPAPAQKPNPAAKQPAAQVPPKPAGTQPVAQVPPKPAATKQPAPLGPAVQQKPLQAPSPRSAPPAAVKPTQQDPTAASTGSVHTAAASPADYAPDDSGPDSGPMIDYAGGRHPSGWEDDAPYKDISSTWELSKPSGMYGGDAVIITGVVTSVNGMEKAPKFHQGMVEFVPYFNGRALTIGQYEALPYDVPHIKPGSYKVVLMDDERHY